MTTRASGEGSDLVFTPEALRAIDRAAVERHGIPSLVLMENAARGLAEGVIGVLPPSGGRVVVVCGKGNNGGDGLACARHLHNVGIEVEVVLVEPGATMSEDAAANLRIVRSMPVRVREGWSGGLQGAVVVDAVLGTGIRGAVSGALAGAIDGINRMAGAGSVVVAADVPSGMDAMTGRGLGTGATPAVRARRTVTFVGPKPGFFTPEGREFAGEVVVAGIGCPVELLTEFGVKRGGEGGRG